MKDLFIKMSKVLGMGISIILVVICWVCPIVSLIALVYYKLWSLLVLSILYAIVSPFIFSFLNCFILIPFVYLSNKCKTLNSFLIFTGIMQIVNSLIISSYIFLVIHIMLRYTGYADIKLLLMISLCISLAPFFFLIQKDKSDLNSITIFLVALGSVISFLLIYFSQPIYIIYMVIPICLIPSIVIGINIAKKEFILLSVSDENNEETDVSI